MSKIHHKTHTRIFRKKIKGTPERPRLCIFRSNKHIYAQLIDDCTGTTLVSSSTVDKAVVFVTRTSSTCEASSLVGEDLAKKSLQASIRRVVFDRGCHKYHGRIKALAESARAKGLLF